LRFLFSVVVFLASFLLFLVEPICGRQLLPVLGGSASVWITCLVFFQIALLIGYLSAHWLARSSSLGVHGSLLLLAFATAILWVLRTSLIANNSAHPILTVFSTLSVSIGLPFLMLSSTSPLMQVWWARVESGEIPYRLYALSNAGSLLALVLYPTVIEPHVTLHAQRTVWSCGFALFTLLAVLLALKTRNATKTLSQEFVHEPNLEPPASRRNKILWVVLPMGAAMQLSAITGYLTANVAAIPLLWIIPLAVYLLTLILAFQFRFRMPWAIVARVMVVMLAALAYSLTKIDVGWPLWVTLVFFLVELFFACFFCHSAATGLRPHRASEATLFYLLFAAGGALGSFLIGIVAPLMFHYNLDLPATFLVTALLALAVNWDENWSQRALWTAASAAMFVLVLMVAHAYRHDTIVAARNFYGSLRVTEEQSNDFGFPVLTLTNGSIRHGTQIMDGAKLQRSPTTYYANSSGVGLAIRQGCMRQPCRIGVIGLGAGTLAAYGRAGDYLRFYEINPAVPSIARNTFTYIRDSAAQVDIVEGDARTSLANESPQDFDVLVVDAFSGDAIPIHLLTTEAMALYRRHMALHGILAFHISNQHVDLAPAIELLAKSAGMQARYVSAGVKPSERGVYTSSWMLVTDDASFFARPEVAPFAELQKPTPGLRVWTDDYSALLPLIRW
jgi:hypothetical protein